MKWVRAADRFAGAVIRIIPGAYTLARFARKVERMKQEPDSVRRARVIYAGLPLSHPELGGDPVTLRAFERRDFYLPIGKEVKISRLRMRGDNGIVLIGATVGTVRIGVPDPQGNVQIAIPLTLEGFVWRFPAVVVGPPFMCTAVLYNPTPEPKQVHEGTWWGMAQKRNWGVLP